MEILSKNECSIIHSPISNLKLGSGVAHVQMMKSVNLNVALGADDASANDSANMFEVMKFAGLIHKLYGFYDNWLGGKDAFKMCLINGAKILKKKIGRLSEGYLADLTILDTDYLFMMPKEKFINQIVFSENGSSVETVIVDGKIIVNDRVITTINEVDLRAEAQSIITKTHQDIDIRIDALGKHEEMIKKMLKAVSDYPIGLNRYIGE